MFMLGNKKFYVAWGFVFVSVGKMECGKNVIDWERKGHVIRQHVQVLVHFYAWLIKGFYVAFRGVVIKPFASSFIWSARIPTFDPGRSFICRKFYHSKLYSIVKILERKITSGQKFLISFRPLATQKFLESKRYRKNAEHRSVWPGKGLFSLFMI